MKKFYKRIIYETNLEESPQ